MEEANWAGESYEKDSLQGTEAAFLKYDRQLQRCPEQCARYRYSRWMSSRQLLMFRLSCAQALQPIALHC